MSIEKIEGIGYVFGKNNSELYRTVRALQAFPSVVGDSGTATRLAMTNPTDILLNLPLSAVTRAYTSAPVVSFAAKAGSVLENGLLPALKPTRRYIPPMAGLLGGSISSEK